MVIAIGTITDVVGPWIEPGRTVRICGMDFQLIPSPHLGGAPLCIQKGQGTVVFLKQVPQGHTWLLKLFTPSRRPTNEYLRDVEKYLPGAAACFTCTQRRLLTKEQVDLRASAYQNPALADLVTGGVLMPKVPGTAWASVAEDLRDGTLQMLLSQRVRLGLALALCIDILEAGRCSHRDLSATNVFVDAEGRVWLIDFECLYHPDLPFQANTTIGTLGYIAPFTRATGGPPDPAGSWCHGADRFALAVLMAEILLTSPDLAPPHEDGTLFSQAQIDEPRNDFVREIIGRLKGLSKPCGQLLERAFGSGTFRECPSPQEWIGALRGMLRQTQAGQEISTQGKGKRRFVWILCAACGAAFSFARARHDELRRQGNPILCQRCLRRQFTESSVARAQHQLDFPEVVCEYCQERFSLPRQRLNALRHRGRPLLCSQCLPAQLERWRAERAEWDISHPLVACGICRRSFRLRRETLQQLTARGKAGLCSACLRETLGRGLGGEPRALGTRTMHNAQS